MLRGIFVEKIYSIFTRCHVKIRRNVYLCDRLQCVYNDIRYEQHCTALKSFLRRTSHSLSAIVIRSHSARTFLLIKIQRSDFKYFKIYEEKINKLPE